MARSNPGRSVPPSADRLTRDLCAFISIPSVNPVDDAAEPGCRELEMADALQARLVELGLESGRSLPVKDRPNVWGRLKGTGGGPSVMLAAHLDTVGAEGYPDAFSGRVSCGRVYGRGACDMKAAIACYLEVIRLLQEEGIRLKGDLFIAGICDEEHLMIGSKHMGAHGPVADFGIIGEPTSLKICPAHKGQIGLIITTHGKAVHSSMPEKGINAIAHMARVIACLSDYDEKLRSRSETHPLCGTGRFSMNVIRGGSAVSAIADKCVMEVDRRTLPGETLDQVLMDYRAQIDPLLDQLPGFKYEISGPTLDVAALDTSLTSPLVQSMQAAVEAVLGTPATISAFPGGTDAPNLGFACVVCGPGNLEQAHSTNEFVEIDQMVKATEIYLRTIIGLGG
jgi:acetylornithine deacetylase